MAQFYFSKDTLASLIKKLRSNGKGIIPTEQKKVFATLFVAILTTVTGAGIVVPLLPVYANDLGASGLYVGMIFGAFTLSRIFLLPVFGRLSDRRGRKPFIVAGLLSYTIISFAFIFSRTIESLIILRFIQGACSAMIIPVVQAYIGEITPEGSEGYSMGLFNLSMFLSLSLGPLLGGSIKDIWSLNTAFLWMSILSAIGLVLCAGLLPQVSREPGRCGKDDVTPWSELLTDKGLINLFVFRYAYTSCIGVIWCFLPLYAVQTFHLSGSQTGILVMLGVFISGLLQLPMGYVADRFNKAGMAIAGGCISAIGMWLPYHAEGFNDLLTAMIIFGLGGGIAMPAIMAIAVIKGEEKKAMGAVMSLMTVAHSFGMLTGAMVAGMTMDFYNLKFSFPCGTMMMTAGTVYFLISRRRTKAEEN